MSKEKEQEYSFWTDKIAKDIITRKKFHYTEGKTTKFKKFVVKTSASISGVLHIGRLSDTIRGDAVYKSLKDSGVKSELIWVAEDMDPLRKVPEGIPKNYLEFVGMPVTDIPDPEGCHKSYAEHHVSEYHEVLNQFVSTKMATFSMRREYKKGSFNKYIKLLLDGIEELREIQNKYRTNKLPENWSPWTPICGNCGKIITPRVAGFQKGRVKYKCEDYKFETNVAKGCGYEGENDPLKGNGKLLWKSEWAAQWARWNVCSEGAGKEYQVPGSAFWINGEIAERILKYPIPIPIFYEHLTINGEKMSASVGNVVYPHDWLEVATPELLRLLYLKDPMRARDFRWEFVPNMMEELDELGKVYFSIKKVQNKRDDITMKRLYEMVQLKAIPRKYNPPISYNLLLEISKILPDKNQKKFALQKLREYGHVKKTNRELEGILAERLEFAKTLAKKLQKESKEIRLNEKGRSMVKDIIDMIRKESNPDLIQTKTFEIIKRNGLQVSEGFRIIYNIILNSDKGPRLGPYVIERGKSEIIKKLESVL